MIIQLHGIPENSNRKSGKEQETGYADWCSVDPGNQPGKLIGCDNSSSLSSNRFPKQSNSGSKSVFTDT